MKPDDDGDPDAHADAQGNEWIVGCTNLGELRGIGESEDQATGDKKKKKINKNLKNIFKPKSFNNFTIPQNWPNLRKTGLQLNF